MASRELAGWGARPGQQTASWDKMVRARKTDVTPPVAERAVLCVQVGGGTPMQCGSYPPFGKVSSIQLAHLGTPPGNMPSQIAILIDYINRSKHL